MELPHPLVRAILQKRGPPALRTGSTTKRSRANTSVHTEDFYIAPNGQKFIGKPTIMAWDIETSPIKGWAFGMREVDLLEVEENTRMLCFSYRILGQDKTHVISLRSFEPYTKGFANEKKMLRVLWHLIDSADILIHQNGDKFDLPITYGRFLYHGFSPPRHPAMTIDTMKVMSRFRPDSRGQDNFSKQYGTLPKLATHGKGTWLGCIRGDHKEWDVMEAYNKRDVDGLIANYELMARWMAIKENRRKPIYAKK